MAYECTLGSLLQNFLQPRQSRLVRVALIIQMKQNRQLGFRARGEEAQVAGIIEGDPRFVFAKALGAGIDVSLEHVDQSRETLAADKSVFEEVSGGQDILYFGRAEVNPRAYLSWFNFRGADQQKKVGVLSGGERNRLQLAKLLKTGGNVMLLDEPTNDLDVDTLRALENAILDFAGCVLVISHDRWFLDRIATHILAFEGGSRVVWFEGNYQEYEEDRRRRLGDDAAQPHRLKYRKLVRD